METFKRQYQRACESLRGLIDARIPKDTLTESVRHAAAHTAVNTLEYWLAGIKEEDLLQHPRFFVPSRSVRDAKDLLRYLHSYGLLYHCEDDAADCLRDKITPAQARALNERMVEAYTFDWFPFECPCGFCLSLDPEHKR